MPGPTAWRRWRHGASLRPHCGPRLWPKSAPMQNPLGGQAGTHPRGAAAAPPPPLHQSRPRHHRNRRPAPPPAARPAAPPPPAAAWPRPGAWWRQARREWMLGFNLGAAACREAEEEQGGRRIGHKQLGPNPEQCLAAALGRRPTLLQPRTGRPSATAASAAASSCSASCRARNCLASRASEPSGSTSPCRVGRRQPGGAGGGFDEALSAAPAWPSGS